MERKPDNRNDRQSEFIPEDEPGMKERFQRTLRNLINTPKHRTAPTSKAKERHASKGRVHKGKTSD
jgi:hypothetical protein